MGRWEPDARGRMIRAAIELFTERGFEQTTAAEIAERAGVTERTFFRHFSDKREVLFDGSQMQQIARDAIVGAPSDVSPLDAAVAGMVAASAGAASRHDQAVRRAAVIAANPGLRERELLKLAALGETAAAALHERGVADPVATLAAQSAVTAFGFGFEQWIATGSHTTFADCITNAAAELRALM